MGAQLTSAVLEARRKALDITANVGRAALSNQFPDDFEYYMCALELVDATDNTNILDYIIFPIMPDNIRMSNDKLQSVTKTSNGVVVLENFSFNPISITLSGNFGRRIKPLNMGGNDSFPIAFTNEKAKDAIEKSFKKKIELPEFSITVKSGYGITKILERMFEKSSSLSNGVPVQMFFYNFAFNHHFLVQPTNIQFFQNKSNNMIWEYSLSMTAIAPAAELKSDSNYSDTLNKYLKEDVISNGISEVVDFTVDQLKIVSNVLQYQAGEINGLNEFSNKIPQLIRAPF